MMNDGKLLTRAINVNDSVTNRSSTTSTAAGESFADGIKRATDVMVAGKVVVIAGYGDVGKRLRRRHERSGCARVITEDRPHLRVAGVWKGTRSSRCRSRATGRYLRYTTGCCDVIRGEHFIHMKDETILCNIGHFDSEIEVAWLENEVKAGRIKELEIKPQVDKFIFGNGKALVLLARGRLVNLGCATGHPSFVMSNSFSNQTLAQISLATETDKYEIGKVYTLPKILDEEVARLHLGKLGAKLERLSNKQSKYLGVPADGPYKPEHYRY